VNALIFDARVTQRVTQLTVNSVSLFRRMQAKRVAPALRFEEKIVVRACHHAMDVSALLMDLRLLKQHLATAPIENARLQATGDVVNNFRNFKALVHAVGNLPPFTMLAEKLRASSFWQIDGDAFSTEAKAIADFKELADEFFLSVVTWRNVLEEAVPAARPETVIATMQSGRDLPAVNQALALIQKALQQLVFEPEIDGKLEVDRWSTGSLTVFLYLGSLAAVQFVGRVARAAAVVFQEIQKGRAMAQHVNLLKEHVRQAQLKNELSEVIVDAHKSFVKSLVDREARAVEADIFSTNDNERLERIKNSIRLLADLFGLGTTITPALEMPKEQRDVFPDADHLLTAASSIKALDSESNKENDPTPNTEPLPKSNHDT
jgi:hypothetical protein